MKRHTKQKLEAMPDSIPEQISRISTLLKNITSRQSEMGAELERLREENAGLKTSNTQLTDRIREMEEHILLLKSSVSPLDEESKKDFEKRINEYLLTIEKCIGLLKV